MQIFLPENWVHTNYVPNVPENWVQTNYVPQVPHLGHRCGTKTSTPQDGNKFTDFWVDLMKI